MDFFLPFHMHSPGRAGRRIRVSVITDNVVNVHAMNAPEWGAYNRKPVEWAAPKVESHFDRPLQDVLLSTVLKEAK